MPPQRILITGASGRLGSLLLNKSSAIVPFAVGVDTLAGDNIQRLDIRDADATTRLIGLHKPDLVIHAAAWTDVDACAREPHKADEINGFGTRHVAQAAKQAGAAMLYISTNEVFDGTAIMPYAETDAPNPVNPYAHSKWLGEQAVRSLDLLFYIVRTAWLFAHGGRNFIQSILNAADARQPLRVVTDEIANPTYNDDLADAILKLVMTEHYGIYHLVNEGAASRYDLARYVLDHSGYRDVAIEPIHAADWKRASTPPLYSPLANIQAASLGITLRPWQQAVDAFLQREGRFHP